jgi:hypothetical protein
MEMKIRTIGDRAGPGGGHARPGGTDEMTAGSDSPNAHLVERLVFSILEFGGEATLRAEPFTK